MAGHLSPLTEKETSALGRARIRVGDGQRVAPHLLLSVPGPPPPPAPRRGPARVWVGAGPDPGPCPAGGLRPHPRISAVGPIQPLGRTRAAFPGPQLPLAVPPLTLPPPAPVWPGFAAAARTVAAIGLRPAASPSPGSRRGAVSACVARGGVGWGRLCVRPRLDRTRSGSGGLELETRRPLPARHRHPDPRSPLGL